MYDLAILGAGWAGYNAAVKAKELGLKVCIIDRSFIGGTCLNAGCIPTKALIQSAKIFALAKKSRFFGIGPLNPSTDFPKVQDRKNTIILQLRQGMQLGLKGVDFISGEAEFISKNELKVEDKTIQAKSFLIATGSKTAELATLKFNGQNIISSDELLEIKDLPRSLLVVGGGVIGCEFASLFCALGASVTIAEKMPQLIPAEDPEIARKLESTFKKKGIKVNTNFDAATLNINDYKLVLVCIGRAPRTDGLGLERIGVNLERGRVAVDDYLRTNVPNIYAAGDCTAKIMLAHYAGYQGKVAAGNIADPAHAVKADNPNVPSAIFTDPEIASVGLSEEKAKQAGFDVNVKKFDFLASGMARIMDEADGFIKVVTDKRDGTVLGASIIGPKATELIATLALAVSAKLKSSQLKETIFAHPTISECIGEVFH